MFVYRLGEEWNDICQQPALKQTNELILSPMNVHNIPPLLANAVIKKPHEPAADATTSSVALASMESTDESQPDNSDWHSQSTSSQSHDSSDQTDSASAERSSTDSFPSMANFLPENTFFYNEKNCYIFPGAEIWWNKDSDLESTSSDSSINDDDDDDDIEDMELSTIERNEIGDVETTIAVENLLENTNEHEFNKYLLKRNASTSLENIHIEENEIDELSPKRLRTQPELDTASNDQHLAVEHTSTMCDTLNSSSSSNSSSTSDPSLPQNEVFSPKL